MKRKAEVKKTEPNLICSSGPSSDQFDLAGEGDSRLCPSGGSFTPSPWPSLSVSPKVVQISLLPAFVGKWSLSWGKTILLSLSSFHM